MDLHSDAVSTAPPRSTQLEHAEQLSAAAGYSTQSGRLLFPILDLFVCTLWSFTLMTTLKFLAGLVVCATLLMKPGLVHAQLLTRAEFFSKTAGDDKDHDTGVWVKVVAADGKTKLADIANAANSSGESTHYNDNTSHTIKLKVDNGRATRHECEKFKFKVGIKANGNDNWKFSARVTLYFEKGKTLVEHITNADLNSRGSTYVETPKWAGGK